MSQRLCDELSKGGPECNGIEVKVQPRQIPCQSTSFNHEAALRKGLRGVAVDLRKPARRAAPEALDALLAAPLDRNDRNALDDHQRENDQRKDDTVAKQTPGKGQVIAVAGDDA
jgi:hypothetical protein